MARHALLFAWCLTLLSGCAGAPAKQDDSGLRIGVKGNKHYVAEGRELTFAELESLLTETRPKRIVVEESTQMAGSICIFLLGIKLDIPVWARSNNGAIQPVRFDVDSRDITQTDICR